MIERIISGGQTGVDRAALDFAIARGIPHGGWCPLGRLAEDGFIAATYQLTETPTPEYAQRTEWNVRDSDGTMIFSASPALMGGSAQTAEFATRLNKPWLHLSRERDGNEAVERLRQFVHEHRIAVLNVAGPRQSQEPAAAAFAAQTLTRWWEQASPSPAWVGPNSTGAGNGQAAKKETRSKETNPRTDIPSGPET